MLITARTTLCTTRCFGAALKPRPRVKVDARFLPQRKASKAKPPEISKLETYIGMVLGHYHMHMRDFLMYPFTGFYDLSHVLSDGGLLICNVVGPKQVGIKRIYYAKGADLEPKATAIIPKHFQPILGHCLDFAEDFMPEGADLGYKLRAKVLGKDGKKSLELLGFIVSLEISPTGFGLSSSLRDVFFDKYLAAVQVMSRSEE